MPLEEAAPSAAADGIASVPRIGTVNIALVALAAVLAVVAIVLLLNVLEANARSEQAHVRYDACVASAADLMDASDSLTVESRMYTVTGDVSHLYSYLNELNVRQRRDKAVATMREQSGDSEAVERLAQALAESNQLAQRELYAMRLTADATHLATSPAELRGVSLDTGDDALPADRKLNLAQQMLVGGEYDALKASIASDVEACVAELIGGLQQEEEIIKQQVGTLLTALVVIVLLLVALLGAAAFANFSLVVRPMRVHARNIQDNEPLEPLGAQELRYVVKAYNQIYAENHRRTLLLKREAETDALTNLLNRGSYDKLLRHHGQDIALIIIDVDLFKQVNDTYGHEMGDAVLKKVADCISAAFRTSDYACRIGGDEFAIIMTETSPDKRDVIAAKLDALAAELRQPSGELPPVTLSIGVAFSAVLPEDDQNIYHAADKALYEVKHNGRNGYRFYGM